MADAATLPSSAEGSIQSDTAKEKSADLLIDASTGNGLCPNIVHDTCPNKNKCPYLSHKELCEICRLKDLHSLDMEQRQEHKAECERENGPAFSDLIDQSKNKECSICREIVFDKPSPDNWFGILESCNHIFCLTCIENWRVDFTGIRNMRGRSLCPVCRTDSSCMVQSQVWVTGRKKYKYFDYHRKFDKNCTHSGEMRDPIADNTFMPPDWQERILRAMKSSANTVGRRRSVDTLLRLVNYEWLPPLPPRRRPSVNTLSRLVNYERLFPLPHSRRSSENTLPRLDNYGQLRSLFHGMRLSENTFSRLDYYVRLRSMCLGPRFSESTLTNVENFRRISLLPHGMRPSEDPLSPLDNFEELSDFDEFFTMMDETSSTPRMTNGDLR